ncbi:RNA methyltransferase [Pararhodobacter marinus]|uniref:RNA methyltransferase n=1 Tax=Pararhodobacter marinus TaxID=2184063 RepID=A0A2U2CE28_9RHOB|nr:RNA methyltransferase [Pararhodobacter marinus]PWE30158.1 RNA methyltransferase [Pararhodobacter marinus]
MRALSTDLGTAPLMVLTRPQMGENIGAAARAMLNFGVEHMRLVAPRDGWPNPKAIAMASGASSVLDNAAVFPGVADAVADCDYVYATTARGRGLVKPVLTPETAMAEARAMIGAGKRVAVLFGPERAGLENDDIAQANAIITVPVNPGFYSLNLAQCVLLTAYEWMRQTTQVEGARLELAGTDLATQIEIEKLGDHFENRLDEAGFFHPPEKAPHMKRNLRNMWGRWGMTRSEVQTLHGALRQLVRPRD